MRADLVPSVERAPRVPSACAQMQQRNNYTNKYVYATHCTSPHLWIWNLIFTILHFYTRHLSVPFLFHISVKLARLVIPPLFWHFQYLKRPASSYLRAWYEGWKKVLPGNKGRQSFGFAQHWLIWPSSLLRNIHLWLIQTSKAFPHLVRRQNVPTTKCPTALCTSPAT